MINDKRRTMLPENFHVDVEDLNERSFETDDIDVNDDTAESVQPERPENLLSFETLDDFDLKPDEEAEDGEPTEPKTSVPDLNPRLKGKQVDELYFTYVVNSSEATLNDLLENVRDFAVRIICLKSYKLNSEAENIAQDVLRKVWLDLPKFTRQNIEEREGIEEFVRDSSELFHPLIPSPRKFS